MASTLKIYQGHHELDEPWLSCHEWWEKNLIMEYGEKIMEDGLETKDSSFLVD